MNITISIVGTRHKCAGGLKRVGKDKDFGVIKKVEFKRIGWFTWYLYFEAEIKK